MASRTTSKADGAPLVSVVIPAYNHAAFVGECIRSVLEQSVAELEVLVTDDASRDETAAVVVGFSDPRLHLEILPKNRGTVAATNAGLRRARGEFICFLSSDDYFLPGKLETQIRFLRENPEIGAVFGLPRPIDERGALIRDPSHWFPIFQSPFEEGLRSRADWLRRFYRKGNCICYPTSMVRRSVIEDIGELDPRLSLYSDFDLWVRLCAACDIHVMPDELAAMRRLDDNRNQSAARRDTRLRGAIERYLVQSRYRAFPRPLLDEIFADERAAHPEWDELSSDMLLVEDALLTGKPTASLFALDLMLEEAKRSGDYPALYRFTGTIDPFGLTARKRVSALRARLRTVRGKLRAETESKDAELRLRDEEIDRLKARLGERRGE